MDLKRVIAELRTELETIDQVVAALEKLAELRSRRAPAAGPEVTKTSVSRMRTKPSVSKQTSGSQGRE